MDNRTVRIINIDIENFKNVKKGSINLENKRKPYRASILGIYGQNGSGKTAFIDAIGLLKFVLCGQKVPDQYADYISVDAESAKITYKFYVQHKAEVVDVWYELSLRKAKAEESINLNENSRPTKYRVEIFEEVLTYSCLGDRGRTRKNVLIDTRTPDVFIPRTKFKELVGEESANTTDLLVNKKMIMASSRSFIYSGEMLKVFRKNCCNETYLNILEELVLFGNRELFIINTENSGLISMNALPISFKYRENHAEAVGSLMLPLNAPAMIPEEACSVVTKVINNMNIVLEQIVPGLTIGIKELGSVLNQEGNIRRSIQLVSLKNGKTIPFQYESEGIKKIVSILQLLIVVYNNSSTTVAIDELDAGIFEYLLGEMLHILSEKGKGQLIFTSHNLRPLETLDKGFIAFTTTNPENRYIRMANVKGNNNLRDFYYRNIVLGEQSEQLYNPTNNYEIALAFREAGESFDA